MVNKQLLHNALDMCLEDYCENQEDINKKELNDIADRFSNLIEVTLKSEATESTEDDD